MMASNSHLLLLRAATHQPSSSSSPSCLSTSASPNTMSKCNLHSLSLVFSSLSLSLMQHYYTCAVVVAATFSLSPLSPPASLPPPLLLFYQLCPPPPPPPPALLLLLLLFLPFKWWERWEMRWLLVITGWGKKVNLPEWIELSLSLSLSLSCAWCVYVIPSHGGRLWSFSLSLCLCLSSTLLELIPAWSHMMLTDLSLSILLPLSSLPTYLN